MARPRTKPELLAAAQTTFDALWETIGELPDDRRTVPGVCDEWSVKDLLAHLDAWHRMFLGWESVGRTGEKPATPAPGFTWKETPALNTEIFERTRDDRWEDVVDRVRDSHDDVIAVIDSYDDEELFEKRRYRWTGSTSVASYAISATSSHYRWADDLIARWHAAAEAV